MKVTKILNKYARCNNIDQFLAEKHSEFIAKLETLKATGSPFWNQTITAEVVEYVRDNQEISTGIRCGNKILVSKIPYMAKEYLAESDINKRRYYYCHCPWARETLCSGETPVPAVFCTCSAGYTKKAWEVIFGQSLKVEVLESVLNGDLQCRFAIYLLESALGEDAS